MTLYIFYEKPKKTKINKRTIHTMPPYLPAPHPNTSQSRLKASHPYPPGRLPAESERPENAGAV